MTTDGEACVGCATHRPAPITTDRHHVYPKYLCELLGMDDIPEVVPLCKTEHDNVHHVIEHFINEGTSGGHVLSWGANVLVALCVGWYQLHIMTREEVT